MIYLCMYVYIFETQIQKGKRVRLKLREDSRNNLWEKKEDEMENEPVECDQW